MPTVKYVRLFIFDQVVIWNQIWIVESRSSHGLHPVGYRLIHCQRSLYFFLEAVWKTDGASEKKYCRTGQAHICGNHANVSPSVTVVGLSGWEISVHYRLHYRHAVVGCEGIETLTMVRLLIFNLYAANDLSTRHGCFVTRTYTKNELGALHTDRIMSSEAAALSRRPICGDILAGNVEVGHCYNPDTGIYWYLQCLYSKFQQCCIQYKFAVSRHNIKFFYANK